MFTRASLLPAGRLILSGRCRSRLLEVEVQLGLLPDAPRPGERDVLGEWIMNE